MEVEARAFTVAAVGADAAAVKAGGAGAETGPRARADRPMIARARVAAAAATAAEGPAEAGPGVGKGRPGQIDRHGPSTAGNAHDPNRAGAMPFRVQIAQRRQQRQQSEGRWEEPNL